MAIKTVVFLIICILLAIILYVKVSKNTEHFSVIGKNAKDVFRSEFGDSTCDLLNNENLAGDGKLMARQYISGNRIRQYKPKDDSIDDSNKCYINYDTDNRSKDYILSDRSCSKDDPFFKNVNFIKNVYVDDKPEKTNNVSVNKCVLEIDKSKVNAVSLQKFWDSVGSSECIQINKSILEYNKTLKDKLDYNNQVYGKQVIQYEDDLKFLDNQKRIISNFENEISELKNLIQSTEKDYENKNQETNDLITLAKKTDSSFKVQIQDLSKSYKKSTDDYEVLYNDNLTLTKAKSELDSKYSDLQDKFNILKKNYNLVTTYTNAFTIENNQLLDAYNNLLIAIVQLDKDIAICKDNSESCEILSDCLSQINQLNSEIDNLKNIINNLRNAISDSRNATQKYIKDTEACVSELGKLNATISSQYAEIERLKGMHEGECTEQKNRLAELNANKEALNKICDPYKDRAKSNMDAQYTGLADDLINAKLRYQACKGTEEEASKNDAIKAANTIGYIVEVTGNNKNDKDAKSKYNNNISVF